MNILTTSMAGLSSAESLQCVQNIKKSKDVASGISNYLLLYDIGFSDW